MYYSIKYTALSTYVHGYLVCGGSDGPTLNGANLVQVKNCIKTFIHKIFTGMLHISELYSKKSI